MLKIAQGVTSPKDWVNYQSTVGGIYVDVDTSSCGFTETPHYITALEGKSHLWCANGANSIYNASPTGFRVYLRWTDDDGHFGGLNPLKVSTAKKYNWHLKWTAIQACQCETKPRKRKKRK